MVTSSNHSRWPYQNTANYGYSCEQDIQGQSSVNLCFRKAEIVNSLCIDPECSNDTCIEIESNVSSEIADELFNRFSDDKYMYSTLKKHTTHKIYF